MSPSILQRVEAAFRATFPAADFSPELSSQDVSDWDSLRQVHFVVALEKEFGIRFDGATLSKMFSIPAVVEAVSHRLERR